MTRAETSSALSPEGAVARALGGAFEPRPQQVRMTEAVEAALAKRGHLLVEAGTGVGKSFAYLVPAIRRIVERNERVVVSTHTIALQEQLIQKDIPLLAEVFKGPKGPLFRAELVKGRGNYVSVRRLMLASERQDRLLVDEASRRSLHVIEDWARQTRDGTLSTLPMLERPGVWDRVMSDSGNCMGRKCPQYERCFYQQARRRMERAELLICNHALFFSDLALRSRGAGFLPEYHHVILDEAHNVEEVASEHFGLSLTEGRVRHLLSLLYSERRHKGFLAGLTLGGEAGEALDRAVMRTLEAGRACDAFFEGLLRIARGENVSVRLSDQEVIENPMTPAFRELALALKRLREKIEDEQDKHELNSYTERATDIADSAEILCERQASGCAYWIEVTRRERGTQAITLACSPIDVAPLLRKSLFETEEPTSVVLTSATLTTGGGSFAHAKATLGCEEALTLAVGSPFDHATQVELHVDTTMPDPRAPGYVEELCSRVLRQIVETDGGAFVLFTSFGTMYAAADRLRSPLQERGFPVRVQGRDGSRSAILEDFRADERSVLFGTSSFWQGVDVRGRGLRNVIITRLPFDPPDRPLTQARLEMIQERGGNPFMEDSLPRAVIRFRQGFGRLIRSATDAGRVVVLDPRIVTARYGRAFIEALPEGVRVVGM